MATSGIAIAHSRLAAFHDVERSTAARIWFRMKILPPFFIRSSAPSARRSFLRATLVMFRPEIRNRERHAIGKCFAHPH